MVLDSKRRVTRERFSLRTWGTSRAALPRPGFPLGLGTHRCFQYTFPLKGSEVPK